MIRCFPAVALLWLLGSCLGLRAVENVSTGTYNETESAISGTISNWQAGWTQPSVQPTGYTATTGWNYVGQLGQESGTYLGNGWVITCAHVGAGNFVLNRVTYPEVTTSVHSFYAPNGTPYDLQMFQVSPAPNLPTLPLWQTDPVAGSTQFALIGYGSPTNVESWGYDTVTAVNHSTPLNNIWVTNDFLAEVPSGAVYQNVDNDSGGGDFAYNSTSKAWELVGLNEGNNSQNGSSPTVSFFVQLDTYAAQIQAIYNPPPSASDTPLMPAWGLVLMGGFLFLLAVPTVMLERK